MSLEQEKSNQACEILKELDIDSWLVWVRETSQMADPVLELVLGETSLRVGQSRHDAGY